MSRYWRKHTTFILVGGVLAIIVATAVAFIVTNFEPKTEVRIGTGVFQAELADTQEERIQGLSGVARLKDNEAMLFVFDEDGKWGIWMKDMLIPLDIIWLNKDMEVVHIVKNAAPDPSPKPPSYTPTEPARYVLEMNAGSATNFGIKVGDYASFTLDGEAE